MNLKSLILIALILSVFAIGFAQTTTLSVDTQVAAANVTQGTIKQPLFHFHLARNATGTVNLTGVTFTTAGTYTSSDVSKFQLWYNTSDAIGSATQISTDITSSLGTGSHSFASFTQALAASSTRYFWITTDVAIDATTTHTINVSAWTTSNFTVSSGTKSGSASAGGNQTVTAFATLSSDSFRSNGTGNWGTAGTWQSSHDGTNWATATSSPTSSANTITIRDGNTVTVAASVNTDQTTINSGGQLNISSGYTLTIADGTGTDMTVNGTLRNNAGTITTTGSLAFGSGGLYQHNWTTNAGTIPTATWDTNSTCEVIGYTSYSGDISIGQTFGNFTWNCPNQTGAISANETLDTVNGNLVITSTGTGSFVLGNATNITTVGGNLEISGGTFNMNNKSTARAKNLTINVSGNFSMSGGTLTKTATDARGYGVIVFAGTSNQVLTKSSGTISNAINFTVNSGAILEFATESTVLDGSTGTFTATNGSTLIIKHADGIAATGSTGCIRTTGTRTFNTGVNYTYAGSASGQITGAGLPTTVNNLTFNNTSGTTLSASETISGTCTVNGKLNCLSYQMGGTAVNNGTITAARVDIMSSGTLTNNSGSTIEYTTPLTIPASTGYYNLTLSASGHYILSGNVTGINTLTLTTATTYLHPNGYNIGYTTLAGLGSIVVDPTIALSSSNPAVAAGNMVQGSTNNVFYAFSTAVTANSATLNAVTFTTAGTAVVTTDLTNFKLWYNSSNLFSGAVQIGSALTTGLSAGSHTFSGLSQTIAIGATGYFWITADLASGATVGRTLQVTPAITTANLTFVYGTKSGTAYAGGLQTIAIPTVTLASSNPAVSAANINNNSTKNPIYRFTLARDAVGGSVNVTGLSFTNTGTYVAADVVKFQLWTNTADALGTATQISSDLTTGLGTGTHTFASFTQALDISATRYFWITTDIAPGAVNGGTMTVSALTTGMVTTSFGTKTGTAYAGGAQTIVSPLTTLASSNPAVAAANIGDGSLKNMIYRFTLARNANGSASLNSVTFTTTGTLTSAEITRLQLWTYSADSLFVAGATAIGEITTSTGAGSHTFSGLSQFLTASATRYFWITADIASGATVSRKVAVSAITTANLAVSYGSLTGTAYAGNSQTIVARVTCATTDYAVPVMNVAISQTKVPVYKFTLTRAATTGTINFTGLTFITGGSYVAADINKFQLWTNTTDNLSTATQVGSNLTTSLAVGSHSFASFTQALTVSSTRYFWITTDFTSSAVVDNVIGVAALTSSNLTISAGVLSITAYSGGAQRVISAQVTLRSANTALPAANVGQETSKYPIYRFTISTNEPVGAVNLTAVSFTTAGTYQSTDVTKFQLWSSTSDQLDNASQIGSDISTSLGTGSHAFSSLSQTITAGSTRFFWITADFPLAAVATRTINVAAMTTSDISVSAGTKGGTAYASSAQTITYKGWTYTKRQPVAQLSGAGTGYQIKYIVKYGNGTDNGQTVYLNGNCRTDFGDVRFYNGTTELKYWMESMTSGNTATFWVKLAGDLSAGNVTVDINYGNANAVTTSNGLNTFMLFDDFGSDLSKWMKYKYIDGSTASIPTGESYARLAGGIPSSTYGHSVLGSYPGYNDFQNNVVEYRYRVASEAISEVSIRSRFEYSTGTVVAGKGYKSRSDQRSTEGQSIHKPPFYGWTFIVPADLVIPVIDQWYRGTFAAYGNDLKFYRDGTLMSSATDTSYPQPGEITIQNHYGSYTDYDWVFVRKYAGSEPTYNAWMYPSHYYRTVASGDWSNTSIWESSPDNSTWSPATMAPDQLSLGILIRNGHTVTLTSNATADQLVVNAGGKLIINDGIVLNVNDGTGTDVTINGTLSSLGNGKLSGSGSFTLGASAYLETQHPEGVSTTASTGCIQVTGTLTLNDTANYTFNGTLAQVTGNAINTANDLTLNNSSGLTLTNAITINGILYQASGDIISETTDYVDGYESQYYNHLRFPETGYNISGWAIAMTTPSLAPVRINRQWVFSGSYSNDKVVTFFWSDTDDFGYNWTNEDQPAVYQGTTKLPTTSWSDSAPRQITVTISGSFDAKGTFTIGRDSGDTLPVELSSFLVTPNTQNYVQIQWVTQSETNLWGFNIYRGNSNIIADATMLNVFIPATNTSQMHIYQFVDEEALESGVYYYWLDSVDLDGSSMLYGPVSITLVTGNTGTPDLPIVDGINSVYPNPFNPNTTLAYGLTVKGVVDLKIYNIKGELIRNLVQESKSKGTYEVTWNGCDTTGRQVSSGLYFARLRINGKTWISKMILSK